MFAGVHRKTLGDNVDIKKKKLLDSSKFQEIQSGLCTWVPIDLGSTTLNLKWLSPK